MLKFPGCHRRLGRPRISGALHAFRQDVRGVPVYRTASWSAAARLSTSNKTGRAGFEPTASSSRTLIRCIRTGRPVQLSCTDVIVNGVECPLC
jgi:hypothetical protein